MNKVWKHIRQRVFGISVGALVTPGDYRIDVAIVDTATGEYSYAARTAHVGLLSGELLPEMWCGLPPVQIIPGQQDAPDAWFLPTVRGRLNLPLQTRRPVHIEVLLNLPSVVLPPRSFANMMSIMITLLKTLSQVELRNGSVDVAVLDLDRGHVAFEQSNVHELDWPELRTALFDAQPGPMDLRSVRDRTTYARFFADEFSRRTQAPEPGRIVIVLGLPNTFPQKVDIPVIAASNARVFYIRFPLADHTQSAFLAVPAPAATKIYDFANMVYPTLDDIFGPPTPTFPIHAAPKESDKAIRRILEPLHPRVFSVGTPEKFRKALAEILHEISVM